MQGSDYHRRNKHVYLECVACNQNNIHCTCTCILYRDPTPQVYAGRYNDLAVYICVYFVFALYFIHSGCTLQFLAPASVALGMENGDIPNSAITSSNSHPHCGPHPPSNSARLNYKDPQQGWLGDGWCGGNANPGTFWLQIDLGTLHVVTKTATQVLVNGNFKCGFISVVCICSCQYVRSLIWIIARNVNQVKVLYF